MNIKQARFIKSATSLEDSPQDDLPEVAFIGRSNVGKSSLINMLTRQSKLAKVSATPGKTRLLNFYYINEKWALVDLPGYGYAKVAQTDREGFNQFVSEYLRLRSTLKIVFVLIDSRLEPQKIDVEFIEWLRVSQIPFAIIFTKADKQSPTKTKKNTEHFLQFLYGDDGLLLPHAICSSKTTEGQRDVLNLIASFLST